MYKKKIIFFTASRADYGKLKPIISLFKKKNLVLKLSLQVRTYKKNMGIPSSI